MIRTDADVRGGSSIIESNIHAVRRFCEGAHRGEFMGICGRVVTFSGIWLARLNRGRLVEQWVTFDAFGLLRQIGGLPEAARCGQ